jgi:phosphopantothenoylcysteine decarboxylase/phosphopantothenate--cysteine ligase
MSLAQRHILVGLSGGIACYKACEAIRSLAQAGAQVHVVMTAGAQQFVAPLTLQTLSGRPVATDTFSLTQESEIGHIRLADDAEVALVAPATANLIAKLAHGLADDLLTTVLLATRAPLLLAPAMNVHMWEHAATQANLRTLVERGAEVVGPASGSLACGYEGPGRLAEPAEIVEAVAALLTPKDGSDGPAAAAGSPHDCRHHGSRDAARARIRVPRGERARDGGRRGRLPGAAAGRA